MCQLFRLDIAYVHYWIISLEFFQRLHVFGLEEKSKHKHKEHFGAKIAQEIKVNAVSTLLYLY